MGMFDNFSIDTALLPVSSKDREKLSGGEFQTQDLDNDLHDYRITDEGKLEMHHYTRTAEGFRQPTEWRECSFTVDLYFYTDVAGEWFEFLATLHEGRLIAVERVPEGAGVKG